MQWGIPISRSSQKDFYMLNKMKIMLAGTIVAASLVSGAAHAASAPAEAEAEILTPVALSAVTNLNFGLIASGATAGTVELTTSNTPTCVDVICVGTAAARGSFQVTAAKQGQVIALSLTDNTITLDNPDGDTMDATLTLSNASITFDSASLQTVYVGGLLNVDANQPAGVYDADFEVNADYN